MAKMEDKMAKNHELNFPDDLCALWDALRKNDSSSIKTQLQIAERYGQLVSVMTGSLMKSHRAGVYRTSEDAEDAVRGFLVDCVIGVTALRPERFATLGILMSELAKWGARKRSKWCYEVNEALRVALHELEREGKVKRIGPGGRIHNSTGFGLATGDECFHADPSTLTAIDREIWWVGECIRDGSSDRKSFLKPQEAERMIERLLGRVGEGFYITLEEIQRIAVNHIRHFPRASLQPVDKIIEGPNDVDGDEDERVCELWSSRIENQDRAHAGSGTIRDAIKPEYKAEQEYGEDPDVVDGAAAPQMKEMADGDLWEEVAIREANLAAARIWGTVEAKSTEKILCLYSIPNWVPEVKCDGAKTPPLREFGDPRRVAEKNEWHVKVFARELSGLSTCPEEGAVNLRRIRKVALRIVYDQLIGRCTEKGLNPSL